jgi:hypothetical protein
LFIFGKGIENYFDLRGAHPYQITETASQRF